jgi:hypothetical protein
LRAFFTAELTQDERFLLAEMLMQSFNDSDLELDTDPLWKSFLERIELNIGLHICTLVYWSTFGTPLEDSFRVSASLRDFLSRTDLTFMGKS